MYLAIHQILSVFAVCHLDETCTFRTCLQNHAGIFADSAVCVSDSLELELSGELVLGLLQLLPAPHVLVVHVLDLRFNALKLGIQL